MLRLTDWKPAATGVTAVAYDKDGAKNSASVSIGVSDLTAMPGWDAVSVGDSKMRGAF